jgi:hypothetical protein
MDTRQSNNLEPAGYDDRVEVTKCGFPHCPRIQPKWIPGHYLETAAIAPPKASS